MDNSLMDGERIILRLEIHWIIFVLPFIYSIAILLFIFNQHTIPLINIAGAILILYFCGEAWIRYLTVSYTITNYRVIYKSGLLFVQLVDMSIDRIESVMMNQSLIGRLFNYGNVIIHGTGGDSMVLDTIDQPSTFRQQVFTQMKKPQHAQE